MYDNRNRLFAIDKMNIMMVIEIKTPAAHLMPRRVGIR